MLLSPISTIIDRIIPDKNAATQAKAALIQLQASQEGKELDDQLQVNLAEAQSKSTFVAGWRPFVGWVCGVAFAWAYIGQPVAAFVLVASGHGAFVVQLPKVDIATMSTVLMGMLGLGAMRSFDKTQGASNGS